MLRKLCTLHLLALLLPSMIFATARERCVLSPQKTQGTWEGWGISLCWWGKVFGDRDDIADLLFTTRETLVAGERLPGLGMTIVRYNAGACSWNELGGRKMVVSKTILPFRQIECFWRDDEDWDPSSASWDWSADANQREMLRKAQTRGADRFELFSNSPTWWMCANDNPSGRASKTEDNLPSANYAKFAHYLAMIARQARENWGIRFTSVSPFNEPISGWWVENGKQEGCYFSPESQAAFLPHLRKALDSAGLRELPIVASDETSYTHALKTWSYLPAPIKALVSRINVHGYEGEKGPRAELGEAARKEHKGLWNSEYGDWEATGLKMARCLALDFYLLRPTAWCYWQALDGGNNNGWGLIGADLAKSSIGSVNPKYYIFAHFSRHIRPGMQILQTGREDLVAACAKEGNRIILVLVGNAKAREFDVDLTSFGISRATAETWITEPGGSARYLKDAEIPVKDGVLTLRLPANAVRTVVLERSY